MRGGRILIGLLAPVLAAQALAQVQSTQQAQQGVGDCCGPILGMYGHHIGDFLIAQGFNSVRRRH